MNENRRFSYLLPAVAMMLGWGLRGFIGGGPFGAMIPGAMVALTLCFLYPRRDAAMLSAFAAVGVGIGGEMTYGQTVGFIVNADTFWWGFLGLALKGAIWGALAGAVIGMAFTPRPMLVLGGLVVMAASTQIGWSFINQPKLIYFSNLLDKPRPEIWAGFLLAALALVGYLTWRQHRQPALRFAVAGFIGGGIGFGGGGAIQGLGVILTPDLKLHWWKYMEFFFGFWFGWALAWAWKHSVLPDPEAPESRPGRALEMAVTALFTIGFFWLTWQKAGRFTYLLVGGAALYLVSKYRWLAIHIACTVTFTGVALDLARYWSREYKRGPMQPAYALAVLASILFAWFVIQCHTNVQRSLNLLMWACVVDAVAKFAINPAGISSVVDHICIGFVLMAAAVSWMMQTRTLQAEIMTNSCASPSSSALQAVPSAKPLT